MGSQEFKVPEGSQFAGRRNICKIGKYFRKKKKEKKQTGRLDVYVLKNPAADMFQAQFIFAARQAFFLLQKEQLSVFSGGGWVGQRGWARPVWALGHPVLRSHVFRWQVS